MKIEVFGSENCKKCSSLKQRIDKVINESTKEAEVNKVTDIERMAKLGIMSTPTVAVDGEVKSTGEMLDEKGIKELID